MIYGIEVGPSSWSYCHTGLCALTAYLCAVFLEKGDVFYEWVAEGSAAEVPHTWREDGVARRHSSYCLSRSDIWASLDFEAEIDEGK